MQHDLWRFRIEDMRAAAESILSFTRGKTYSEFCSNSMLMKAVLHDFAVLGEAAAHVPTAIVERYTNIPWHEMRAMRNVVVHEYSSVRTITIWETIQDDLEPLIVELEALERAEDSG